MASNPGARCCTIGVKHEGEAKGEVKNIGNSKSCTNAHRMDARTDQFLRSLNVLYVS
jgi:hypothetical protein